jgi:type II secretory ATPase GspE/PulE/Tfp pilus assembly ATPase PilB-like protein
LSKAELADIELEINNMPESARKEIRSKKIQFYRGKGCKNCGQTGYKGRIGLYEVQEVNNEIKSMIAKRSESAEIKAKAMSAGMTTMIQDGIIKAIAGITTIEEVFRATKE